MLEHSELWDDGIGILHCAAISHDTSFALWRITFCSHWLGTQGLTMFSNHSIFYFWLVMKFGHWCLVNNSVRRPLKSKSFSDLCDSSACQLLTIRASCFWIIEWSQNWTSFSIVNKMKWSYRCDGTFTCDAQLSSLGPVLSLRALSTVS